MNALVAVMTMGSAALTPAVLKRAPMPQRPLRFTIEPGAMTVVAPLEGTPATA